MARRVVALAGGVGAARFLRGLVEVVPPEAVTAVVNTGDDDRFHTLHVCPDIDSVVYTLAGASNPGTGWGLAGESFRCMDALDRYGAPTWFRLGDLDLATHLYRTTRLAEGASLTDVTAEVARAWGLGLEVLPMSDDPTPTLVTLAGGRTVPMQEWFVALRAGPALSGVDVSAAAGAEPAPGVLERIEEADVVVLCPSNPFLSLAPVLAVPGVREAVAGRRETVVGISPVVGGEAVKGPLAGMLRDLGHEVSCAAVAALHADVCGTFVIDEVDAARAPDVEALGVRVVVAPTLMSDLAAAARLAAVVLDAGAAPVTLTVVPVEGLPEITPGADLAGLLADAVVAAGAADGDCLVITQKVVSKSEQRLVAVDEGDPTARARLVEGESARVLRRRGDLVISETRHGFICANAGVDFSNVPGGHASLLPVDPDRSARRIRDVLRGRGLDVAVVVSDTFGRPWRMGVCDVAIGVAGLRAVVDLRGTPDASGRSLQVTEVAVADEVAAAAELVMGKARGVPAALVRGLDPAWLGDGSGRDLIRPPGEDLFR